MIIQFACKDEIIEILPIKDFLNMLIIFLMHLCKGININVYLIPLKYMLYALC